MTPRQKREISRLVSGLKDPRQGIVGVRGVLYAITRGLVLADVLGLAVMLLLASPVAVPLAIIGHHFFAEAGALTGAVLGLFVFLAWVFSTALKRRGIEKRAIAHGFVICLWCQHPLDGLPERGRCPECGKGFDRQNTRALYKAAYDPRPYQPEPKVVRFRKSRAWARALRERDGDR